MGDEEKLFPPYFFSKAPLPEKTTLIPFNDGKKNHFIWKLSLDTDFNTKKSNNHSWDQSLAPYDDNDADLIDCCDLEDNYEINPTKSGKYLTSFYVPSALQSVIIGARGLKLKELQEKTQTLIKVPRPNEPGNVKITGQSERSVASARTQVTLLVLTKREKMKITHFISVPIYSSELVANFNSFKDGILKGSSSGGIDGTLFQKVEKLHLTIATLTLLDEQEIEEAKTILSKSKDIFKGIFGDSKPKIILKGVEIMNDDPTEVDVLYGKVELGSGEANAKFQILADDILSSYYKSGLVRKQYDTVKLHVTLMNSLYRKNEDHYSVRESVNNKSRESFNASYILDKYKDFYFGSMIFDEIHLSIRFSTSKSGYYDHALIVNL